MAASESEISPLRVGLVGCGNIGAELIRAVAAPDFPAVASALFDVDTALATGLREELNLTDEVIVADLAACAAQCDLLVEAAAPPIVEPVVRAAIAAGIDCLVMSISGLLMAPEVLAAARDAGVDVRTPSGALAGLDGLRAAREAGLDRVTLTTSKPPAGLAGAPHLQAQAIDLDGIAEAVTVFEGNADEAIRAFPKNVNVAATLSLAGIGAEQTTVRIVADPALARNTHRVEVEGDFGRMTIETENVPSPRNPRTSYLATLSAIAEVRAVALDHRRRQRKMNA